MKVKIFFALLVVSVLSYTAAQQYQTTSQQTASQPELVRTINTIVPNGLGEQHSITYYTFDTGAAGPSIVIISGVHGDEPASLRAAMHIINNFEFSRGRFLIIPRANPAAVAAGTRTTPGYSSNDASNLNRQFPGNGNGTTTQRIAAAITNIVDDFKPDVVIDLHEAIMGNDWETTGRMPNSIFFVNPNNNTLGSEAANSVVAAINRKELVNTTRDFRVFRNGLSGQATVVYSRRYNIPTLLIETGRPRAGGVNNPLALRIEQQLFLLNGLVQFFTNAYTI